MSKYLLSIYHGPGAPYASEAETAQVFKDVGAFNDQLQRHGAWVFADGLQSAAKSAAVVDGTGNAPMVTDGPYLETKEHLGGFWIIDVPDHDTAMKYAEQGSKACRRPVEVRPFAPTPEG